MIDSKLNGRVTLVTGGNHGIGAAIAQALAAQGAKVFITFLRPPSTYTAKQLEQALRNAVGGDVLYQARRQQTAEAVLESITKAGGLAGAAELDLADAGSAALAFDRCERHFGGVEILVCNHAHCVAASFDPASSTPEDRTAGVAAAASIDAHFAVNTRSVALLMAEFARRHVKAGRCWGRIVNISTDAAHAHSANISYAASKHATESYSRSAACELGRYGITVNVVSPGPIQTGWITPSFEAAEIRHTPLGRIGLPEDIADVVVFLASHQARWVTGQLLYVGGGYRMPQ